MGRGIDAGNVTPAARAAAFAAAEDMPPPHATRGDDQWEAGPTDRWERFDDVPLADAADEGDSRDERAAPEIPYASTSRAFNLANAIGPAMARFRRRAKGDEKPVQLPWSSVNEALGGGLWPGVTFLVGSTGLFKTGLALEIAAHAAAAKIPVLYIGLELGDLDLVARLVGIVSGVRWSALWNGEFITDRCTGLPRARVDDVSTKHLDTITAWPFRYVIAGPNGWSYTGIHTEAAAMRKNWPEKPDAEGRPMPGSAPFLVVLDYLQIVGSPTGEELRDRIRCASYAARAVARDLNAAVLVLSSTARQNYGTMSGKDDEPPPWIGGDPTHHVGYGKESGEIEYSADAVLVLFREYIESGPHLPPIPLHLAIAKCRAGRPSWCSLMVDSCTLRIRETTNDEREAEAIARKVAEDRKNERNATDARGRTGMNANQLIEEIRRGLRDHELDELLGVDQRVTVRGAIASRRGLLRKSGTESSTRGNSLRHINGGDDD